MNSKWIKYKCDNCKQKRKSIFIPYFRVFLCDKCSIEKMKEIGRKRYSWKEEK